MSADDDWPRRARRDVLDVGRDGGRRAADRRSHPRDLDDDDDRAPPRRDEGRGERRETRDAPRRERDGDRRDERGGEEKPRDDDRSAKEDGGGKDDAKTGEKKDDGGGKGDEKQGGDGDADDKAAEEQRRKRRPRIIVIAVVVLAVLIAGGVYYYLSHRGKAETDDAYTDGNVVSIAPQVSGQVVVLAVNDNQFVRKGDILIQIDPRQFQYSREQAQGQLDAVKAQVASQRLGVEIAKKNFPASLQLARANLQSAQANLELQQANNERQQRLPKQATTQQEVDTTSANLQQAQAQVAQNQARVVQAEPVQQNIGQTQESVSQLQGQQEQVQGQLDQADLNVEWATVRAPQDGWVTRRNVNVGNYVQAGTQIMQLVTTDMWVTANYKETELDGMHPGQKVTITVDAYPDLLLQGHVDSIQRGSGSKFSAFPAENATGNFVKIVQRVPVKILIDSGVKADEPLPLGISVEPTVFLK